MRLPIPRQIAGEAEDGSVTVRDLGSTTYWITLQFTRLSRTDFDALVVFFTDSDLDWSMQTFTYTDYTSVGHTVRLWPGSFDYSEDASGLFNVSMKLRES